MSEDTMSQEKALYGELAKYYDRIYHWKDYRREALKIKRLIRNLKRSSGKALLDVACGTGQHIRYLQDEFSCNGIDASEQMLAVARRNAPGVRFVKGNMVDFRLGRKFDVVLCLFSSIGYLRTRSEVRGAVANFARHMKEGGVLIVEPWIRRTEWKDETVNMQTYDSDSLKIARVNFGRAKGRFSILDEGYLIAEEGKGILYIRDKHKIRFFEVAPMLETMRKVGLEPEFTEDSLMPGRGLVIAIKS